MRREFSESRPELMDLPNLEETALRHDLQNIARLNRTFGGSRTVEKIFRNLAGKARKLVLVDIASGYGDHGRNIIHRAATRGQDVVVVGVDKQFQTLRIAREATPGNVKMFFVQADARQLPFRPAGADLAFCSLALHHFSDEDAGSVLAEMRRVARFGSACIDLSRSRLACIGIWLMTIFFMRDPMVRHDARISIRRAFTCHELARLAGKAGWNNLRHQTFVWFQQAILNRPNA